MKRIKVEMAFNVTDEELEEAAAMGDGNWKQGIINEMSRDVDDDDVDRKLEVKVEEVQ